MNQIRHLIIALLLALPAPALRAQDGVQSPETADTVKTYLIDEVIVTGTRSKKKIVDVPYPVDRVPETDFRYARKTSVNDVLGAIPGLFLQSRYGNHDVRISMRGFGSRSNTGIRGIRILLDGIPESEPDGQTRIEAVDFNSLGAIELVRGNLSSAYTNAPGGVINFINDLGSGGSALLSFNQFGSFGLHSSGIRVNAGSQAYRALGTYNYHSARGYRPHSVDYWHTLNGGLQVIPDDRSTLSIHAYYVEGLIRLPGSLTREQFDGDPYQANPRDVARDTRRLTKKGRVGVRYNRFFGGNEDHELEVTGYGTMKYFERVARSFRIFNRNGIGMSAHYRGRTTIFGAANEFTAGLDAFYQTGPIEEYRNIGGTKSDVLEGLTSETIGNNGMFVQDILTLAPERLDLTATLRYDNMSFSADNRLFELRNARRVFSRTTPKAALNYKFTPHISAYASYGLSFDSPADNEMDNYPTSSNPTPLLNPDLDAQKSKNLETGIKGSAEGPAGSLFGRTTFEASVYHITTEDEIVPFEVFGDVFFRNAASSARTGVEAGFTSVIAREITLRAAYAWSDFTYTEYAARSTEVDSAGNIVDIDRDFSGHFLPSNPVHNLTLSAAYEKELSGTVTAFLRPTLRVVSGLFVDDRNSEQTDGYGLVDIVGGVDMKFGRFNLLVSGGCYNIADRTHVSFVNINSATGEFYEAGAPRNYFGGINLGYQL
ncbi:MAG TPA: TonB-dependent receptor [Bacteroidota bacterium]|nr:TonB-dependent receptor [Bacteroidota bacterium]